jgi:hypothetical protein
MIRLKHEINAVEMKLARLRAEERRLETKLQSLRAKCTHPEDKIYERQGCLLCIECGQVVRREDINGDSKEVLA